jgi:hypothetical protein
VCKRTAGSRFAGPGRARATHALAKRISGFRKARRYRLAPRAVRAPLCPSVRRGGGPCALPAQGRVPALTRAVGRAYRVRQSPEGMRGRPATRPGAMRYASTSCPVASWMRWRW